MSGRRIRIVYLSHTFTVGGAEEMALNLVRHLPRERYEPMVCAIYEPGPLGREIGATATPFATLGRVPGMRDPFAVGAIYRYLRDVQPDIVHTFLLTASLYGRLAAILARVPIVIGTEVNMYAQKRAAHIIAERLLMAGTDAVIASAHAVKDFYVRQVHAASDRVSVIYNAVDWKQIEPTASRSELRARLHIAPDAVVAGVIARLTPQKAHDVLLDALAQTRGLETLQLLVIGDGELRTALESQAARLGLTARVRFLGTRRDLGDLLAAMDIFVLPSRWEGLPLSLLLAMGAERAVVATRVAGIPEVVTDGVSGLLVAAGDRAQLGRALVSVVADSALRQRLGRAARAAVVPRFGVDAFIGATTELYERLIAGQADVARPAKAPVSERGTEWRSTGTGR
jgi:glycosyltransferase involved in cell wall biosynthesis